MAKARKHGEPTDQEWAEIRKVASRIRRPSGGMLPPGASALDRMKYELCRRLLVYMQNQKLTQRELAKKLGVVESRVSEALHYQLQKVTLDRLVRYHQTLNPKFTLKFA